MGLPGPEEAAAALLLPPPMALPAPDGASAGPGPGPGRPIGVPGMAVCGSGSLGLGCEERRCCVAASRSTCPLRRGAPAPVPRPPAARPAPPRPAPPAPVEATFGTMASLKKSSVSGPRDRQAEIEPMRCGCGQWWGMAIIYR